MTRYKLLMGSLQKNFRIIMVLLILFYLQIQIETNLHQNISDEFKLKGFWFFSTNIFYERPKFLQTNQYMTIDFVLEAKFLNCKWTNSKWDFKSKDNPNKRERE